MFTLSEHGSLSRSCALGLVLIERRVVLVLRHYLAPFLPSWNGELVFFTSSFSP